MTSIDDKPVIVVGIGASAGGHETLQKLLRALPRAEQAAFVVVQHRAELLAHDTQLKTVALSGAVEVEPNTIYCTRPGDHAVLEGSVLRLVEVSALEPQRLPIDRLFESLAESRGAAAIGVVLSGSGRDGTHGARAIRSRGGVVLVQDPREAAHDGMPNSVIQDGSVDEVLGVERLAAHLVTHIADLGDLGQLQLDDHRLDAIIELLRARSSQDFGLYKATTVRRRIERRMSVSGVADVDEYIDLLRADAREVDRLTQSMRIGVTDFFRDAKIWDELARELLPELVARVRANDPLRVWVAGCATGEEAYSMAICVIEAFEGIGRAPMVQIFATDVDEDALAHARLGRYPSQAIEVLSAERRERFFECDGESCVASQLLRERIVFSRQDLLRDPPFGHLDLVSCRNLLIYLEPMAQRRVLTLFHYALRPQGVLVLGNSESVSPETALFDVLSKKSRLFRRSAARPRFSAIAPSIGPRRARSELVTHGVEPDTAETMRRILLREFAPASVLIDQHERVLFEHGPTDRYLGRPSGPPNTKLFGLLREGLEAPVRRALREYRSSRARVVVSGARLRSDEGGESVTITVVPARQSDLDEGRWALIAFTPKPDASEARSSFGDGADSSLTSELERELEDSRVDFQALVEEYEASTEELRVSTEEVMSVNEELQSSNEELETSKEELQSLNEDLNAVNATLQQTITELEAAHDDLSNLMHSTQIPTLFLDTEHRIKRFTAASRELFHLIPEDVGRPLADFASKFDADTLVDDVREVLEQLTPRERTVRSNDGRVFVRRLLPYRTRDDRIAGVVATFTDVTALLAAQGVAEGHLRVLERIIDSVPLGISVHELASGRVVYCNGAVARQLRVSPADLEASGWPLASTMVVDADAELQRRHREILVSGANGEASCRLRFTSADGRRIHYDLRDTIFAASATEPAQMLRLALDVSLEVATQESLELSEARARARLAELEHIYQNTPIGLGLFDRDFRFVRSNEWLARLHGLPIEQHRGRTLREVLPEHADRFEAILSQVCASGESVMDVELEHAPPGSSQVRHYLANFHPFRDEAGDCVGTLVTIIDVTKSWTFRRKLAASEARYRQLLEHLRGGVIETDAEGRAVYLNTAARELFAREGEAVEDLATLVAGLEPAAARDALVASARGHVVFTEPLAVILDVGPGGGVYHLQVAAARLPGSASDGRAEGMLYMFTDVTARVIAEGREREIQKLEAIGQLGAGVAHDINNVLHAILANVHVLGESFDGATPPPELESIEQSVERAAGIITQLLVFGRMDAEDVERLPVSEVLGDLVPLLRASLPPRIELRASLVPGLHIELGRAQLSALIFNLVNNASEAIAARSGVIALELEALALGGHESLPAGDYVRVRIRDDGSGMSAEVRARMFEPYFSTRPPPAGTGLGLSVVHGIVSRAGGAIEVESSLGQGTQIDVLFPSAGEPASRAQGVADRKPRRIYLVDDEVTATEVIGELLERRGYQVRVFSSPRAMLEVFRADPDEVDVLVTDLLMPEMSGAELVRVVREQRPGLRVVVCTGTSMSASDLLADDNVTIVQKPISAARLITLLQ